ncbi:Protein SPT10 [Colletotrichum sp. SAR11_59]|nr:Protein SPT10 [Colletotrichum sp. SAR11_59]
MPAMLDDPASPTIYRVSGAPPYPDPNKPELPADIVPRQVTLRDRQTVATIIPFVSQHEVPQSLVRYLSDQLNKEIEGGDTYPMTDRMPADKFGAYWFQNFGAIMLLGNVDRADLAEDMDWSRECLGSFYIKPNYPGRSSHVCNAGFLVTDASRNRGVGRLMGECYIDWAPKLGYTYSVFNLVYETNVASCKIWDALGFKRIGRVKGCGNLKSHPGVLIDAIIYGRDLVPGESEELVSEERFDKIKFYLKYGKYPAGADRAEKSRLRSAATHYKLLDGDRLMLKDKEVVPDPRRQYEIAREVHVASHGGINKTTATIAEKYHWSRIKETPIDPQIIGPPPTSHDPYNHYHPHHTDFQALLNATEAEETPEEAAAVDRDLDMLIEQGDEEEDDVDEPMGDKGRDKEMYGMGYSAG